MHPVEHRHEVMLACSKAEDLAAILIAYVPKQGWKRCAGECRVHLVTVLRVCPRLDPVADRHVAVREPT
ncbi:MAG: hypothetical protein ABSG43_11840, partial [Solirubrobacteraceae bacterium]